MSQSNTEVEIKTEVASIETLEVASEPVVRQSPEGWTIVSAKSRVDSFNQDALVSEIRQRLADGHKRIALDLKGNRFFSLQVIRFCVDTARELAAKGGRLALISPSEKTQRHFEIYGSLNHIAVVRSESDLTRVSRYIEVENSL